jgi:hypothetical protein
MLTIPGVGGRTLVVLEPGNIKRLKAGKPLVIQDVVICFTPDMEALTGMLGVEQQTLPKKGEPPTVVEVNLSPEQIDLALRSCQNLPEVDR